MPSQHKHKAPHAVFVHGAGGGGWEWDIWRRVFIAQGWSALAPDLLPAPRGLAATCIKDYVQQVSAWCSAAPSCVLIGASLGGLLALMLASELKPAALVLINALAPHGLGQAGGESKSEHDYVEIVRWGRDRSLAGTRHAMPDADDAACHHAFRRWRDESGAVLRAAAQGVRVEFPRCPILVLASEHDTDVLPATSRALAHACAAEFRVLDGASHVGPLLGRNAARNADAVLTWCTDILHGHKR